MKSNLLMRENVMNGGEMPASVVIRIDSVPRLMRLSSLVPQNKSDRLRVSES
jgi:hypothetical protein